jgi:hypothetical protein
MMKKQTGLLVIALTAVLSGLSFTSKAEAQADGMYFGFGMGPLVGIGDTNETMFKLEESFGFHILSNGPHPGLFLAPVLSQAFAENHVRFTFGLRAGYDIQVYTNGRIRLLATPMLNMGFALHAFPDTGADARGFFNMGFGGEVRLVLPGEKLTIWLRPTAFEFDINDGSAKWYDFMFGININF